LSYEKYEHLYHPVSTPERPMLVKEVEYRRSEGTTYHMHYATELAVLRTGTIERLYLGSSRTCEPGQIWFCGVWEPHGYAVVDEPCTAVVFITSPDSLAALRFPEAPSFNTLAAYLADPRSRPQLSGWSREEARRIATHALEVTNSDPLHASLWSRTLLTELLLTIYQGWDPPESAATYPDTAYAVVNKAIAYTFASEDFLPVHKVSSVCGMDRTGFSRLFKRVMGIGFSQFALRYRLSRAAEALVTTGEPLKAIAFRFGFADESHLHRSFRHHDGCAPSEFRNRRDSASSTPRVPPRRL
jgi:AraC-like DNA-binding protein